MNPAEMLDRIGESLASTATVRSVFGEPIHTEGKTIIPLAKVAYGFGAGGGTGPHRDGHGPGETSDGGGGGGGVRAFPAGALEITQGRTRFVPLTDYRLIGVFAVGALVGGFLLRRPH